MLKFMLIILCSEICGLVNEKTCACLVAESFTGCYRELLMGGRNTEHPETWDFQVDKSWVLTGS